MDKKIKEISLTFYEFSPTQLYIKSENLQTNSLEKIRIKDTDIIDSINKITESKAILTEIYNQLIIKYITSLKNG
jgi:hypothetical protein